MKKALSIILALFILLSMNIAVFAEATADDGADKSTVYFSQNFDGVTDASALGYTWEQNTDSKAAISVDDGKLVVDNLSGTADAALLLYAGDTSVTDFILSYDFTIIQTDSVRKYAGLVSWYKDPTNYVGWWLRDNGEFNFEMRKGSAYTGLSSNNGSSLSKYDIAFNLNETYSVKIVFINGFGNVFINNALICSGDNKVDLDPTGKFAIYIKDQIKVAFDNIQISSIPSNSNGGDNEGVPVAALIEEGSIKFDGKREATEGWSELPTLETQGTALFRASYPEEDSSLKAWLATDGKCLYVFLESSTMKTMIFDVQVDFSNTDAEYDSASEYKDFLDTSDNNGNKSAWVQFDSKGSSSGGPAYYEPRTVAGSGNKYGWSYIPSKDEGWQMLYDTEANVCTVEFCIPLSVTVMKAIQTNNYTIGFEMIGRDRPAWSVIQATENYENSAYALNALRDVVIPCVNGSIVREAIASVPDSLIRTPKAGEQLNPFAVIPDDVMYESTEFIVWVDESGTTVTKAEAGKTYIAVVVLTLKSPLMCFDLERTQIPSCYTNPIVSEDGMELILTRTFKVEESQPVESQTQDTVKEDDTTADSESAPVKKSGCKSSISSAAVMGVMMSVAGAAMFLSKKKKSADR